VTYEKIIACVGTQLYEAECALAHRDAARPDYGRGMRAELSVPEDIEDLIWVQPQPWVSRVSFFFRLYDEMPSYRHLVHAKWKYALFDADARRTWWTAVAERLAGPSVSLRQPLEYSLW